MLVMVRVRVPIFLIRKLGGKAQAQSSNAQASESAAPKVSQAPKTQAGSIFHVSYLFTN